jgi:hypothetical protein
VDAGSVINFSEARVFQMVDAWGKTTQIRLSMHSVIGNIPPAWNDSGWAVVSPGDNGISPIGAGTLEADESVTLPPVLALGSRTSRYIKIEAYNDGTLGNGNWIELRSLKLY